MGMLFWRLKHAEAVQIFLWKHNVLLPFSPPGCTQARNSGLPAALSIQGTAIPCCSCHEFDVLQFTVPDG